MARKEQINVVGVNQGVWKAFKGACDLEGVTLGAALTEILEKHLENKGFKDLVKFMKEKAKK